MGRAVQEAASWEDAADEVGVTVQEAAEALAAKDLVKAAEDSVSWVAD